MVLISLQCSAGFLYLWKLTHYGNDGIIYIHCRLLGTGLTHYQLKNN